MAKNPPLILQAGFLPLPLLYFFNFLHGERGLRRKRVMADNAGAGPSAGDGHLGSSTQVDRSRASRFRVRCTNLYITWPQCPIALPDAFARVRDYFKVPFVISLERHEDGNPHLHALIMFPRMQSFNGVKGLKELDDILGALPQARAHEDSPGYNGHGNYQSARSKIDVLKYVVKDGNYKEHEFSAEAHLLAAKKKKSSKSQVIAQQILDGANLKDVMMEEPGFFMMHGHRIGEFASLCNTIFSTADHELDVPSFAAGPHPPMEFNDAEMDVWSWLVGEAQRNEEDGKPFKSPQLYVHGPSNCGKTSLVLALRRFWRVYDAPKEKWDTLWDDESYEIAVFDEFACQREITYMNQFLEGSPMTVPRKTIGPVRKCKNVPCLILTNRSPELLYTGCDQLTREAFLSRLKEVRVDRHTTLFTLVEFIKQSTH